MRSRLSRTLGIPRSTGYYHHTLPDRDEALRIRIETVMEDNPAYGHERVAMALDEGTERIRRVMSKFGLRPTIRRVKPWQKPEVTDNVVLAGLQNLIRDRRAERPFHIWASDFTYIWFNGMWYCLATVLDIYNREIVGWAIG
jgi:putative transposase